MLEPGFDWPTETCTDPVKFAYPRDTCMFADALYPKEYGNTQLFQRFECDKARKEVKTYIYADRQQCHERNVENRLKIMIHSWNVCFEDYPNEFIKVFDCYEHGMNFTRCNIEEVTPSASPTKALDCDSCINDFAAAGGCPIVISTGDDGDLITPECDACTKHIFRWCFAHTTPSPSTTPKPTAKPTNRPGDSENIKSTQSARVSGGGEKGGGETTNKPTNRPGDSENIKSTQ